MKGSDWNFIICLVNFFLYYKQHVKTWIKLEEVCLERNLAFSWEVVDWNTKLRKTKNGGRGDLTHRYDL